MNAHQPVIETQMLIRKPVSQVFNAFIDPEQTRHFWFTKASGKLEKNATVVWEWEMYNVSANVTVKNIIPDELIAIDWGTPATAVDFTFKQMGDGNTYVVITNYGFQSEGEELMQELINTTGGFTTVLDGLKAYMEHGINLNLIADKFPGGK